MVTSVWKLGFIFKVQAKNSVPLWKSLGIVVKTLCLVSIRSYWRTFFFRIIYQILSFRTLSVNFLDVWQTFFAWFVKTAFYGFRGHFWSKNFEWKLNNLLVHKRRFLLRLLFGICASHPRIPGDGNCGCFARGFLVGLLKLNLSFPEDTIGEKRFSKYSSYSSFLDCQQKFLECLGEIFLVEKKFPSVCDFKLMTFRLRLQRKLLAEKYFCGEKVFLHQFPTFSSWCLGLWQKTGRFIKSEFYLSRGNFWQETIFEKKQSSFSVMQQK